MPVTIKDNGVYKPLNLVVFKLAGQFIAGQIHERERGGEYLTAEENNLLKYTI